MLNERIIVNRYGGPEVLQLIQEPIRELQNDELLVKVESAGVALADIMRREGIYPMTPTPPFTPGYEAVGIVEDIGDRVTDFTLGDKVGVFLEGVGGYAKFIYAKHDQLVKVPQSLHSDEAAAVILNYVTAYQMLHRLAKVREGETILIHGASGGVGTALLDLGRLYHIKMFGTASLEKHDILTQFGAIPIDYKHEDFVELVNEHHPNGIDVVFDPIGGQNWERSLLTLNKNGRLIAYGFTSVLSDKDSRYAIDDWVDFGSNRSNLNEKQMFLYSVTQLKKNYPKWFQEDVTIVLSLLEKGKIKPMISHRIPLKDAAYAQTLLESSKAIGKIILKI